jgi:hypothetical protein
MIKKFFNNAFVHVVIVAIFGIFTQWLTSNAYDTLTVGTVVHAVYELILSYTSVGKA